ncbi:kinesin-like protein KIN-7H isoform X2 [Mangifera indica]|uniref:kinesin-like protein KIN-7H isoform X2 n=1 Tax=Mangifera indica TaxID=29780 RepID=UPI001CFAE264|nr:kinesin-like protein KIN-7H isoform X2 [Mangifera indica]
MVAANEEEPMRRPRSNVETIFVSIRLRPLNEKEIARNDVSDWECINETTIMYRNNLSVDERSTYSTVYTFDRVFSHDCTTKKVYEEGAKEVALSVVSGINSSVFAYGQTSSGKTYTMTGITEYSMTDIFDYIDRHKEREFILKFSAMEIYNESVRDLLSTENTPLRLLDDPEKGTIVEKLTEETLKNWSHFKELLSICEAQRQIGETSLNETSSRSHQILRLTIESSAREFFGNGISCLAAAVSFVDLAGSERASQALSSGTRLKEGCHINRSLLTLGTVIRKLRGRSGHVPYRDSKLTRILQSSLGGSARTAIICTLSPARVHVEQSRDTLLFASCAKEVSTNAQVNIVMSDKALVKHLQRELSRLENELRSSGVTSNISDIAAILGEKDIEIEKLKRELSEMTQQRDLARAQIEDLLQEARNRSNDRLPIVVNGGLNHQYPKLRVRNSLDSPKSETCVFKDLPYPNISVRSSDESQSSDGQSRSGYSDNDFQENSPGSCSFQEDKVSHPIFVGIDLSHNEIKAEIDENVEDLYKDVQCIQTEEFSSGYSNISESSSNRYRYLNATFVELNLASSGLTETENEVNPTTSGLTETENEEVNPTTSGLTETVNEDREKRELRLLTLKEEKKWKNIVLDFVIPTPKESSPLLLEKDMSSSYISMFGRSSSCKARFMTSVSLDSFKSDDKDVKTPPTGIEKDYVGRPWSIQRKFSPLKYVVVYEKLSRNESQASVKSGAFDMLVAQNVEISNGADIASVRTLVLPKESTDSQDEKQFADHEQDAETKHVELAKNVRDVGLDPMETELIDHWMWPDEFKKLQREILDLWHDCNVSLVHRTYFFLVFKGDPKDSMFMELEHKRLSFLKEIFSRGKDTVENGKTVTHDSSLKALQKERYILSSKMKKKLSMEQRQNLFLKWGIGLQSKHRRRQLVNLIWNDSKDLKHVAESASVVEKLVSFAKSEQVFMEIYSLNYKSGRPGNKFKLWISNVKSGDC